MRRSLISLACLSAAALPALAQQSATPQSRVRVMSIDRDRGGDGDRAVLGVSMSSSGKRDTLGVLVASVTPGGPAEKAGIEEGNRIAAINGVSLRLPREDAGDDETTGAMQSRLQREMRKVKAGDDVTLDIWAGGRSRTVKVKTVAADDLSPARISRTKADERAAIGVSLGSTGNKRDTAGVYVSAVTDGGPAEKAGIIEGDRLAAINGVDLRVAKEDAGDAWVASARVQRLQREIAKLKPGQTADLTVISGGRSRTVKVTTIKSSELPRENGFAIQFGDGFATPPMPPMPAMAPMAPLPPMPPDLPRALETARAAVEQVRLRFGRTII